MNKRPEITEKTRQKLIGAFWQLYRDRDVSQIRIGEITDLAGYNRGTFYEYFPDIYALLEDEIQSLVTGLAQGRQAAETEGETASFFAEVVGFYRKNGEKVSLLLRHGNRTFLDRLKEALYPLFLEENGLQDDGRCEVIYEFGVNGILMSLDCWYSHQDRIGLDEFLLTLRDIIQNGIIHSLKKAGGAPDGQI